MNAVLFLKRFGWYLRIVLTHGRYFAILIKTPKFMNGIVVVLPWLSVEVSVPQIATQSSLRSVLLRGIQESTVLFTFVSPLRYLETIANELSLPLNIIPSEVKKEAVSA